MNSDEVALAVDDKYPQFLMSWKHFLEIQKAGGLQKWSHQRRETEEKEMLTAWDRKKLQKNKKAFGSMEFCSSGCILSFTSYAVKEKKSELGFCQFLLHSIKSCFASCLVGLCCCCRGKEDDD